MMVTAALDQHSISDVEKGMKSYVTVDVDGEQRLDGTISFVSPIPSRTVTAEQKSDEENLVGGKNEYEIWVDLARQNDKLRLGMTLKTTIVLAEAKQVFAVPYSCIIEEDASCFVEVFDADNGWENEEAHETEPKRIAVKKGLETDYYVEIISDELAEGMEIRQPEQMDMKMQADYGEETYEQ